MAASIIKMMKVKYFWRLASTMQCRRISTLYNIKFPKKETSCFHKIILKSNATLTRDKYSQRKNKDYFNMVPMLLASALGFVFTKSNKDEFRESVDGEPKKQEDNKVIFFLKYAKLSENRQEYKAAEEYYHKALTQVAYYSQMKEWDDDKVLQARIYIYSGMANLALYMTQFSKAENLFKETLKGLLQQGVSKDDNSVIDISLKLAMIYAVLKRYEEAEKGYMYCIKTQEAKIQRIKDEIGTVDENTLALFGLCIDSFSKFLLVRKKYAESLIQMQKAFDVAILVFGEKHPQVAVLCNDIASVHSLLKDYESAKTSVQRAIAISEEIESFYLPVFYCNLAAIFYEVGDYTEGKQLCIRAVKLAQANSDSNTEKQAEKIMKDIDNKI